MSILSDIFEKAKNLKKNRLWDKFSFNTIAPGGFFTGIPDGPPQFLLDFFGEAAASYSVRKLNGRYRGPAIRVRRSSDNTETDIFFSGEDLNTASLLSFVGAGNGFVTVWFDQSGFGRHAIQSTAASQPIIVSSGSLLTRGGRPRMDFNGTTMWFDIGNAFGVAASNYQSFVGKRAAFGNILMALSNWRSPIRYIFYLWSDGNYNLQASANGFVTSAAPEFDTSHMLLTGLCRPTDVMEVYKNKTLIPTNLTAAVREIVVDGIGRSDLTAYANCELQEIVFYNRDMSSSRVAIENNISSYYSIP